MIKRRHKIRIKKCFCPTWKPETKRSASTENNNTRVQPKLPPDNMLLHLILCLCRHHFSLRETLVSSVTTIGNNQYAANFLCRKGNPSTAKTTPLCPAPQIHVFTTVHVATVQSKKQKIITQHTENVWHKDNLCTRER